MGNMKKHQTAIEIGYWVGQDVGTMGDVTYLEAYRGNIWRRHPKTNKLEQVSDEVLTMALKDAMCGEFRLRTNCCMTAMVELAQSREGDAFRQTLALASEMAKAMIYHRNLAVSRDANYLLYGDENGKQCQYSAKQAYDRLGEYPGNRYARKARRTWYKQTQST